MKASYHSFEKYFLSVRRTILEKWEERVEQFIRPDPGSFEARNALAMYHDFILKDLLEELTQHVHSAYGTAKCVWSENTENKFSLIYLVNVNNREIHICFTPIDKDHFGFVVVEAHEKIAAPTSVPYPISKENEKGSSGFVSELIKTLDAVIFK